MKVAYEYSHLGGKQILQVDHLSGDTPYHYLHRLTREDETEPGKNKTGQLLYSPTSLNSAFAEKFHQLGYRELKDQYDITIPHYDKTIRGSYKQIDFVKDKVLIEVQFGKYAFMFYDMAKFQYFFNERKADVGVEIVPCHHLKQQMSTGVAYGEQLVYDIERLKRHFPAVPIYVVLIDI